MLNQEVIIRTENAGVHYGTLVKKEYTPAGIVVKLSNSRRIWSWSGAQCLSDLASIGPVDDSGCNFSMPVLYNEMVAIEIIPVTEEGKKRIEAVKLWIVENAPKDEVNKIADRIAKLTESQLQEV